VIIALLMVLAACASPVRPGLQLGDRPNIVFVLTDDLSMNLLQYMPHVRQLERAGMTMSKFYVVDSLCCPSRTATFTGQYPHTDGVYSNSGRDGGMAAFEANNDELRTFGYLLHAAGYRTGFMGKYLNGYDVMHQPADPGWDVWDVAGNGYPEFNYRISENGYPHLFGHKPTDYLTDVLANKATQFINSARSINRPFVLEVTPFAPHRPYVPAPRYRHAYPTVRLPRTPAFDRLPTNAPSWLKGHPPLRSRQIAKQEHIYLQRVRADLAVDDLIARLLAALRSNHLLRNTYVVFSSDNGYHLGDYRLTAGKQTAFDTDVHVPLVVMGPGVPPGTTDSHLAANIDLAPSFEQIGGVTPPVTVDGTSLLGIWHGANPSPWQKAMLIEHRQALPGAIGDPDRQSYQAGAPPSYEAVRTDNALLVRYLDGQLEYYRTDRDPYELHDLGAAAAPPTLLRALDELIGCVGRTQCQAAAQLSP
jgi:N-acetylglucosamine-6-sulfatase